MSQKCLQGTECVHQSIHEQCGNVESSPKSTSYHPPPDWLFTWKVCVTLSTGTCMSHMGMHLPSAYLSINFLMKLLGLFHINSGSAVVYGLLPR